jgi:hypothetical protein
MSGVGWDGAVGGHQNKPLHHVEELSNPGPGSAGAMLVRRPVGRLQLDSGSLALRC